MRARKCVGPICVSRASGHRRDERRKPIDFLILAVRLLGLSRATKGLCSIFGVGREVFHCARRIYAHRLRPAGHIRDGRLHDRNASDPGILHRTRPDAGRNKQAMRNTACAAGSGNDRFAALAKHHCGATVLAAAARATAIKSPTAATPTLRAAASTAATAGSTSTAPTSAGGIIGAG